MLKNLRHEAFCLEYHKNGFNGLQAYKKVYGVKNEGTAKVNANKLLTNTQIKARLKELEEKNTLKYQKELDKIKKLELENKILNLELENQKLKNQKVSLKLKEQLLKKLKKNDLDLFFKSDLENLIKLLCDDLYFIFDPNNNLVKIGRSIKPEERLITLKNDYNNPNLQILKVKQGLGYLESKLHQEFKEFNVPVKYKNGVGKEWFVMNDLIKLKINKI